MGLALFQVSRKRSEGKEADNLHGGEYEAAVNQEKHDDRRSRSKLVARALLEESDSGSEQDEVSVAALNVRTMAAVYINVPRPGRKYQVKFKKRWDAETNQSDWREEPIV